LNYGDARKAKVKRMKEKSRGQISEVRSHRRINFDIQRVISFAEQHA